MLKCCNKSSTVSVNASGACAVAFPLRVMTSLPVDANMADGRRGRSTVDPKIQ